MLGCVRGAGFVANFLKKVRFVAYLPLGIVRSVQNKTQSKWVFIPPGICWSWFCSVFYFHFCIWSPFSQRVRTYNCVHVCGWHLKTYFLLWIIFIDATERFFVRFDLTIIKRFFVIQVSWILRFFAFCVKIILFSDDVEEADFVNLRQNFNWVWVFERISRSCLICTDVHLNERHTGSNIKCSKKHVVEVLFICLKIEKVYAGTVYPAGCKNLYEKNFDSFVVSHSVGLCWSDPHTTLFCW